ncbi:PepSY-like domain-containing protein [Flavobacterium sp. LS1R49]|uniref:PepSY-like domain-containing protein n=1 Tax=Flavobacterium shii TaxID=2987687 RepID=A0A9X3BZG5_9FLAO|nr:PepSY-like domain-containing protein [Flavobacterium shii]MCV9930250.1 PepSY-like domain-containing protein [Flavobacterium shii]
MKKLILSAAIVLGSLSVSAATAVITESSVKVMSIQDEYTEVGADALPAAVKGTVEKSFPGAKLEKAYKNEKNEYKLEIAHGEKKFTIFSDAAGNLIKK